MATGTLTDTTIAARYKSLLKLTGTGNDVLAADASAKYVEDGDGNDSSLSLSTTRVGIGTTSPSNLLHLEWSDDSLTGDGTGLLFTNSEGSIADGQCLGTIGFDSTDGNVPSNNLHASAYIAAYAAEPHGVDEERRELDSGYVGIGTDSPDGQLHISGSDDSDQVIIENTNTGSGTAPDLVFYRNPDEAGADNDNLGRIDLRGLNDNGTPQDVNYAMMQGQIIDASDGTEDGLLSFSTMKAGTLTETLVCNAGNVGIGTATPENLLHLSSTAPRIQLDDTSSGSRRAYIDMKDTSNDGWRMGFYGDGVADYLAFTPITGDDYSADPAIVLLDTGNVGIGTTSPAGKLHIQTAAEISAGIDATADEFVLENADNCGMTIISDNASGKVGSMLFGDSASSTVGGFQYQHNPSSGTERLEVRAGDTAKMVVLSSGNVGIGIAAPTAKLEVTNTGANDVFQINQTIADQDGMTILAQHADYTARNIITGCYELSSDAWHVMVGYHGDNSTNGYADVIFDIEGNGDLEHDGSISTGAASDFAEYWESTDGKALSPGDTTVLENGKVRACKDGESPMGVVRPWDTGAFIGNAGSCSWVGKYTRDDYGNPLRSENEAYKINPDYDWERDYVKREKRDEWNLIGLLGQVPVTKGQPMASGWIKMWEVSDSVDMYYIFPVGNEDAKIALLTTAIQELSAKVTALENA
jgi:hypothetical protein